MWELSVSFLVLTITIITHSAGETATIHHHRPNPNCGAFDRTPEQLSSKWLSQRIKKSHRDRELSQPRGAEGDLTRKRKVGPWDRTRVPDEN